MYNEERKRQFLKEKSDKFVVSNNIYGLFDLAAKREEVIGRDICEWNSENIIDFYKYISTPSIQTLIYNHNLLTAYTQWCIMNGLVKDNQNHFAEIKSEALCKCVDTEAVDKMIFTREEMLDYIAQMPNYIDRFIFLGLFEGITMRNNNLTNVKVGDLDGYILRLSDGKEIAISSQLASVMRSASRETTYISMGQKRGDGKEFPLENKDTIVRAAITAWGTHSNPSIIVGNRIRKCVKYLGVPNISVKMIIESGRIDFIKKTSANMGCTASDLLSKGKCEVHESIYGKIQNKMVYMRMYGKYFDNINQ